MWKWGAKSGGLGDSRGAEDAEVERHRIEAPKTQSAPREVGCGEGAVPLPRKFFLILELKKVSSGACGVLFFAVCSLTQSRLD